MPAVSVTVTPYPYAGVVNLEVEEATPWGLVNVLTTPTVGTFPNYITTYAVTVSDSLNQLRARWEINPGEFTAWFPPTSVGVPANAETVERLKQAVIQKATRVLMLSGAPLGSWGALNEFGVATVRADHEVQELLYGLRFINWDVDLVAAVDTDDVIRQGMQTEPADFPTARVPDVQRAIDTAASWVASYLLNGSNVA